MKYRSSVETSYQILLELLENKNCQQKKLPQTVGKDYRTIIRHLNQLYHWRLIKKDRNRWAGQYGNSFTLTLKGLIESLKIIEINAPPHEFNSIISKIIRDYVDVLPLFFGKWQFFKDQQLEFVMLKRFRQFLRRHFHPWATLPAIDHAPPDPDFSQGKELCETLGYSKTKTDKTIVEFKQICNDTEKCGERAMERNIYVAVFFGLDFPASDLEKQQWFNVLAILCQDPEIKGFIQTELGCLERDFAQKLQSTQAIAKFVSEQSNKALQGGGSSA